MERRFLVAGLLIIIPTIVLAILPLYNRASPSLLGLPFFYWFQTLWLVISAVMYVAASLMISRVLGEK